MRNNEKSDRGKKEKKKIFQQKKYLDQNFPLTELPEPPVDIIAFDNKLDARNV